MRVAAGTSGAVVGSGLSARHEGGMASASFFKAGPANPEKTGRHLAKNDPSSSVIPGRNCWRAVMAPANRRTCVRKAESFPMITPEERTVLPVQARRKSMASAAESGMTVTIQGRRRASALDSSGSGDSLMSGLDATGLDFRVGSHMKSFCAGAEKVIPDCTSAAWRASKPASYGDHSGRGAFGFLPGDFPEAVFDGLGRSAHRQSPTPWIPA